MHPAEILLADIVPLLSYICIYVCLRTLCKDDRTLCKSFVVLPLYHVPICLLCYGTLAHRSITCGCCLLLLVHCRHREQREVRLAAAHLGQQHYRAEETVQQHGSKQNLETRGYDLLRNY